MTAGRVDMGLMNEAPELRMIANFGVGFAASERRIPASNTPVVTDATADLTFTLMLALARRVLEGDRITRAGQFRFWAPMHFLGQGVSGKTLGIIGLGRIGRAAARRAKGFQMEILYHSRGRLDSAQEKDLGITYCGLDTLLGRADFVSLHVPLTGVTRHLIGREELALMRPSAYLINTHLGALWWTKKPCWRPP